MKDKSMIERLKAYLGARQGYCIIAMLIAVAIATLMGWIPENGGGAGWE